MLYYRALWRGIADLPAAVPALRAAIEAEAARRGWAALHADLAARDPRAAQRIHPNDPQRIQRALEVIQLAGRPLSELQAETTGSGNQYQWHAWALVPADRARHRELLVRRFDAMLDAGLAAEVQALHARADLSAGLPALRSVGYRQLWQWCLGNCTLGQARELAITATGQLAKRQLTWVRSEHFLQSLVGDAGELRPQIAKTLRAAAVEL
jgi:tRNA dimethylallyltransferase